MVELVTGAAPAVSARRMCRSRVETPACAVLGIHCNFVLYGCTGLGPPSARGPTRSFGSRCPAHCRSAGHRRVFRSLARNCPPILGCEDRAPTPAVAKLVMTQFGPQWCSTVASAADRRLVTRPGPWRHMAPLPAVCAPLDAGMNTPAGFRSDVRPTASGAIAGTPRQAGYTQRHTWRSPVLPSRNPPERPVPNTPTGLGVVTMNRARASVSASQSFGHRFQGVCQQGEVRHQH